MEEKNNQEHLNHLEAQRRYRLTHKPQMALASKKYRLKNLEKIKKKQHQYFLSHKKERSIYAKNYYSTHKKERYDYEHRRYEKDKARIIAVQKKWRADHREQYLKYQKTYSRYCTLSTSDINGKRTILRGLKKRFKPERCEICDDILKKSCYHHWDDKNPSLGVWCCQKCHGLIEKVDICSYERLLQLINRYLHLKRSIDPIVAIVRDGEIP